MAAEAGGETSAILCEKNGYGSFNVFLTSIRNIPNLDAFAI